MQCRKRPVKTSASFFKFANSRHSQFASSAQLHFLWLDQYSLHTLPSVLDHGRYCRRHRGAFIPSLVIIAYTRSRAHTHALQVELATSNELYICYQPLFAICWFFTILIFIPHRCILFPNLRLITSYLLNHYPLISRYVADSIIVIVKSSY